jgi:glycosidase
MNYPFLNRTIDFLKEKTNAWEYSRFLNHQYHTYPQPMYYTLMNLMSSHDVCRMRSVLSGDFDAGSMTRKEQAEFVFSEEELILGGKRQRLAAAIQFSLPGIPSVYYGDEAGMTGLLDPFNRLTFRREDNSLTEWYMELAMLRKAYPVMSTGDVRFLSANGFIFAILRYAEKGLDHFGKEISEEDAILTVVNPTGETHRIVLDLGEEMRCKMEENMFTSRVIKKKKGLIEIEMPPVHVDLFRLI